jgi:RimJ/RimL family protein N-acetyltransferase
MPENAPSIRLLERLGYIEVTGGWPKLLSYDPGDRVYRAELLDLNIDASFHQIVE